MADYSELARNARIASLSMIYWAGSCHVGSCFSCADILSVVYSLAKVDGELKEDRDRVVISKGWVAALVYFFLVHKGILPDKVLRDFYLPGTPYIGLLERRVRGVEFLCGSMGIGFLGSLGYALSKKIKKEKGVVYCLMSDGEMQIGMTWECAAISAHHKLDNLIVICDYNRLQAMGNPKDILSIEPLRERWESFGLSVLEVDGHNHANIERVLLRMRTKPTLIIAKTTKGAGSKVFAGKNLWHYKNVDDDVYDEVMREITSA